MSRIAILALVLWVGTLGAAGYLFLNGYTAKGSDGREIVLLTPAERDQVLAEMRGLLEAVADITGALGRNDTQAVVELTKPVGMAAMAVESPALIAKLPLDFKAAGLQVHQGFDALGAAAGGGATAAALTAMLSEQLMVCTGCHASYQFSK